MSILGYVAKQCARYDTDLIATNRNVIVYPLSRDRAKQSYAEVGKADNFRSITSAGSQTTSSPSGVTGIMFREQPATTSWSGVLG